MTMATSFMIRLIILLFIALGKKCLEVFWSVFFDICTEQYLSVFSPNAGKYRTEKLRILTLFTRCRKLKKI